MVDLAIARTSSPTISSIRFDERRKGFEAARMLHSLLRGERLTRRVIQVPAVEVVERESTVGRQRTSVTDVDRALEYIHRTVCDNVRVEDVAAHVRMSLRTFEIQFAKATGRTIGETMRDVRLARVKHLLETTDLPIYSIAKLAGMNGGRHLHNFFKRWAGVTPLTYRKETRCDK
jgi:LacI family transcriptional regulator